MVGYPSASEKWGQFWRVGELLEICFLSRRKGAEEFPIGIALWDTDVTSCDQQWGVLLSKHQKHKLVKDGLSDSGVQYFLPLIETTTIVNGRHVNAARPLLGRYIFFVIDELWKNLSQLRGVAGMMLNVDRDYPARVDDGALDAIRTMCIGDVYSPRAVEMQGFVYGQRVAPQTGPLAYHVGRYDGVASKHREAALFNLFGKDQRIFFKSGELIAA